MPNQRPENLVEGDKRAGSRSGQQIGQENTDRLKAYLDALRLAGLSLPLRKGRPNLSAIAAACGFDRQVLYHNPGAATLLSAATQHWQAHNTPSSLECRGQSLEERLTDRLQARERRIAEVEGQLLAARAENEELRKQVSQLEERNARLRHFEAHALETGRRIS
jgi:hypothetical protein